MCDDIDMVRLQFEMTAALSAQVETSSDRMLAHQQSILASQPASIPPVGHVRPAGWAGYPPPPPLPPRLSCRLAGETTALMGGECKVRSARHSTVLQAVGRHRHTVMADW